MSKRYTAPELRKLPPEDRDKGTYTGQTTVLARITNAEGQTVHTLSQQYLLTGASKDLEAARQGQILFYRQPELKPGTYMLQTIVHDALSDRASVRSSTIIVPARSAGRTLSAGRPQPFAVVAKR